MPKGKGPKQDITGKRYGRLIAIEFKHFDKRFNDCWLFRCDCGSEKVMPAAHVKWSGVRSCGCLKREHIKSLRRQDIAGQKYGRLTAINSIERHDVSGSIIWECRCECGNTVFYSVNRLKQGRTKSCGCLSAESRGTSSENRSDTAEETTLSALVASKELRTDNTSGHTGVCYDKRRNNWLAYINFQKKRIHLGSFKEKEAAVRARTEAAARLHDPIILEHWNKLSERGKEIWKSYSKEAFRKGNDG